MLGVRWFRFNSRAWFKRMPGWPQLRTADMAERTVEVRVWLEAIVSQIATIDTDCISG